MSTKVDWVLYVNQIGCLFPQGCSLSGMEFLDYSMHLMCNRFNKCWFSRNREIVSFFGLTTTVFTWKGKLSCNVDNSIKNNTTCIMILIFHMKVQRGGLVSTVQLKFNLVTSHFSRFSNIKFPYFVRITVKSFQSLPRVGSCVISLYSH